jgi:hypothetical protein
MDADQMTGIHASNLALNAMRVRVNKLLDRIDTDKSFTRKLPRQDARIIRACKRARLEGTKITQGQFNVIARYA